jgi:hypothetical protein
MAEHAKLAPSDAKRWLNCPGSIRMSEGIVEEPSAYAAEGSLAHWLVETTLKNGDTSTALIGPLGNKTSSLGLIVPGISNDIAVDQEMIDYTQEYVDLVYDDNLLVGGKIEVELETDLSWLYPGGFGHADAAIGEPFGTLHVYDLKYGKGVLVDPEWNPQQMLYALGVLGPDNSRMYSHVELVIVQPRIQTARGTVRRWTISVEELYKWAKEVKAKAALTADPLAPLCVGPWCSESFCSAMAVCPEMALTAVSSAVDDFSLVEPIESVVSNIVLPHPSALTVVQQAKVHDFIKLLSPWAKAVEADLKAKMESGVYVPGKKLVLSKGGKRKWKDAEKMKTVLAQLGDAIYTERKLKSPAQIEKIKGVNKKALANYWEKPEPKNVVADEEDPRPPVQPSAVQDFLS